jgi:propionate catabolism operon transcriptional regulator
MSASFARPRVLIVGYRKFGQLMNAVADEFRERADIRIVEHLMGGDEPSGSVLGQEGVDVVISAGANAAWLAATLTVPVVALDISDADVVEAIAKASEFARRILLLTYGEPRPIIEPLRRLSGLELEQRNYITVDEAREQFLLARRAGFEVVVGSSLICELAEREDLPAIMLYTRASCRTLLERAIARVLESARGPREAGPATRRLQSPGRSLVFASPEMQRIDALIPAYAEVPATVLIQGESGTGKELVARRIHGEGPWASGEFVAVNCGAIPEELFESELFGYAEGAFTSSRRGGRRGLLELAHRGVIFLDEVGEMPAGQQAKLLRVIEERRIRALGSNREISLDIKIVAATNADLRLRVREGSFREDLYYRLNVFRLHLLPLRERPDDIVPITRYLVADYLHRYDLTRDAARISAVLEEPFASYRFPGNVRELENFVERTVVSAARLGDGAALAAALPQVLPELYAPPESPGAASGAIRAQEQQLIRDALRRFGNDRSRAAEYLGISQTTLWRRLKGKDAGS